jgi:hypothetical protein
MQTGINNRLVGLGKWVLPEHREALYEDDRSLKRKTKPDLDEQEIIFIDQAIFGLLKQNRVVTPTVFNEWGDETIVGTVQKVVTGIKQIKVMHWDPYIIENECVRLFMGNILRAELKEIEEWDDVGWE